MDAIAAGATLTVVILLSVELYEAVKDYRNGRLQLRKTDFLSRIWTAVVRGSKSLWKEFREAHLSMGKKESELEDLASSSKPSLKDAAKKVKASFGRGRLLRQASSKQEPTSGRVKESSPAVGSTGGKRNLGKKPSSRTMAAMLVR